MNIFTLVPLNLCRFKMLEWVMLLICFNMLFHLLQLFPEKLDA